MTRDQLEHLIRASADIANDDEIVVVGSQAILGAFPEAPSDLLISNDMGLAHIAPAVGTRTIVIFGPTNPVTTRPYSDNAVVASANVECAPCMLRDCPIDHRCMTRVTPQMIFEEATKILKDGN